MVAGSNPVTRLMETHFTPEKHRVRLTETDVQDIVQDKQRGMMIKDIAEFYDVSVSTVINILGGRTHSKVTGIQLPSERRLGRRPAELAKLDKPKFKHSKTRRVTFEFTNTDGVQRFVRTRLPKDTTREALYAMAKEQQEPKETFIIYVRYENGSLCQSFSSQLDS